MAKHFWKSGMLQLDGWIGARLAGKSGLHCEGWALLKRQPRELLQMAWPSLNRDRPHHGGQQAGSGSHCGGREADTSWQENLPKRYIFHVGILYFIWSSFWTSLYLTSCVCNALIIMINFTTFIWWLCISAVWNGANCWLRRRTSGLDVATWDYSGSQKRELYCNLGFLIPWQNKWAHLSPRLCSL